MYSLVGVQRHPMGDGDSHGGCSLSGETRRNEEFLRVVYGIMGTEGSEVAFERRKKRVR